MLTRPLITCTIALAVAVSLTACGSGMGPVWEDLRADRRPVVERLSDTSLRIAWPVGYTVGGVTVYSGASPDTITRDAPVGRTWGLPRSVTLHGLDPARRYYFELVPDYGAPARVVAERRLPLEGGDNFRDIGGYRTEDGRYVRWGRLYRSNDLASLSGSDLRYLASLDVQLVCDFRSVPERSREPNKAIVVEDVPTVTAELPIKVAGVDPVDMRERIRTGRVSSEGLERTMVAAYRSFVTDFSDQWADLFERISEPGNLPTIVHCTAGKDRTGFASALVLLALGVPKSTVYEDYLATNRYRAGHNRWLHRLVPIYSLFRTRGGDLDPLLEARRPYLAASFDAIEERYGSVDGYLEQRLGVTPERRERLRHIFLR